MNEYSQPGGVAYGRCDKHQVPLIGTITEDVLCAVCEKVRADEAERERDKLQAACERAVKSLVVASTELALSMMKANAK